MKFPSRVMEDASNQPNASEPYYPSGTAKVGFRTFASQLLDGEQTLVLAEQVDSYGNPSGAWEIVESTFTTSPINSLSRSVLRDSSSGTFIDWNALGATPRLSIVLPADHSHPYTNITDRGVSTITTNYSVASSDDGKLIAVDASAGAVTVTLPASVDGFQIIIRKVDSSSNAVTIVASGTETIDGSSSVTIDTQWASVSLRGDGTGWQRYYASYTGASSGVSTITTNYSVASTDDGKLLAVDASSGAVTVTLPASTNGFDITIRKVDSSSNAVTVAASGAETIDGASSITIDTQWAGAGLRGDGTGWHQYAAYRRAPGVLHVQDQKPSGTNGGTSVAGWQTRTLNTVVENSITGASLASNQITLPAGAYRIWASAPAFYVKRHKTAIYDVTNSAYLAHGTSEYNNDYGAYAQTRSFINGDVITLSSPTVLELRHYTETGGSSTNNLGVASNTGYVEIYSDVYIEEVL